MAVGRQKVEWDRAAYFAAHAHRSLTGEVLDHTTLIPEQLREKAKPKRQQTAAELALDTKMGIQRLGEFLKNMK